MRRCLEEIDIEGIQRLWSVIAPGAPQPASDSAALLTIHMARVRCQAINARQRDYSRAWLGERERQQKVYAVGIAVLAANPARRDEASDVRAAMAESVSDSIRAGIDIETEGDEIRRRMLAARAKARRHDRAASPR